MSLEELYPKEWKDLTEKKVPKEQIDEYLLNFVARLLKEVKEGKREDIDLGDGFSIGRFAMDEKSKYKLPQELYEFLGKLANYKMRDAMPGTLETIDNLETPEEVETELKKVAKKLGIKLNF